MRCIVPIQVFLFCSACARLPPAVASEDSTERGTYDCERVHFNGRDSAETGIRLEVPRGFDSIVLYGAGEFIAPEASAGVPCANAPQTQSCDASLSKILADFSVQDPVERTLSTSPVAVTSRHGEVRAWGPLELASLLAPIDSPSKAYLMVRATMDQNGPYCGDSERDRWKRVRDGYEVHSRRVLRGCRPWEEYEIVYRVHQRGSVVIQQKSMVNFDAERCLR